MKKRRLIPVGAVAATIVSSLPWVAFTIHWMLHVESGIQNLRDISNALSVNTIISAVFMTMLTLLIVLCFLFPMFFISLKIADFRNVALGGFLRVLFFCTVVPSIFGAFGGVLYGILSQDQEWRAGSIGMAIAFSICGLLGGLAAHIPRRRHEHKHRSGIVDAFAP